VTNQKPDIIIGQRGLEVRPETPLTRSELRSETQDDEFPAGRLVQSMASSRPKRGLAQPYTGQTSGQAPTPGLESMTWATFVHRRRQARLQRKLFQTMVIAMSAG
jgi:hypothetical protein